MSAELKYGRRMGRTAALGGSGEKATECSSLREKFPNFGKRQLEKCSCEVAEDEAGGRQLCSDFAASVKKTEE